MVTTFYGSHLNPYRLKTQLELITEHFRGNSDPVTFHTIKEPAHARDFKSLLFYSSVFKPFFHLVPAVGVSLLQSRRERKCLEVPLLTYLGFLLPTF